MTFETILMQQKDPEINKDYYNLRCRIHAGIWKKETLVTPRLGNKSLCLRPITHYEIHHCLYLTLCTKKA